MKRRLWYLLTRSQRERDLQDEVAFHLSEEAEERQSSGATPNDAWHSSKREFGNIGRVLEDTRAAWGWTFIETLLQDFRFAVRGLRKNPGFSALAILILALGIGATTAVFSVVNAVLLKPLAYRDPDRIVALSTLWKKDGGHGNIPTADFRDWREQSTSFDAMAYYSGGETAIVVGPLAEFANDAIVSPEFFRVFGVEPVAGRLFHPEETQAGSPGAAVISYAFWQNHYAGDRAAIGKTIGLGGRVLPIVGVLPPGFKYPFNADIWIPANTVFPDNFFRGAHNAQAAGRLKSGVSIERAQAEMTIIGDRLEQQYPASNAGQSIAVASLRDELVRDPRQMLYLLLGAVVLVLLIACGNVANLLLAKATTRTREVAVRAALGAARGRIIRQMVTESLLLAVTGGTAGILLARGLALALTSFAPGNIPRLEETGLDLTVLAFAAALSSLACLLFGVAPAFRATRVDVNDSLKQAAARGAVGAGSGLRQMLVVLEIGLSVVLLIGAGLLIRSFAALYQVNLGYQTENVLIMETSIPASSLEESRRAVREYKALLDEGASIPGIIALGATRVTPGIVRSSGPYEVDQAAAGGKVTVQSPQAVYSVVAPGAFRVLGIPLKSGRDFNGADTGDGPPVAIVNETLARRAFPGQDATGHTIVTAQTLAKPMMIVGVVGDIHQRGPGAEADAEIYMAYEQQPRLSTALRILARTSVPPQQVAEALRQKAREISPQMPVKFTTMEARMSENVAAPRFRTLLLAIFAALAVILAMAGVYGVVSFMVNQRANEIGLRMALGAGSANVMKMILKQGLHLAAAGLVLGLIGAAFASRLLTSVLFGVQPFDIPTFAVVAGLVAGVTAGACLVPARRAALVDPMVVLRQD